ncbi:MAG: CsgG/HfaB family protein, partial [bacterium]
MNKFLSLKLIGAVLMSLLVGCATETHRAVPSKTVDAQGSVYAGEKTVLLVGKFQNRTNFAQGLFSTGVDRLGNQAKTILQAHLNLTGRFTLVDRQN